MSCERQARESSAPLSRSGRWAFVVAVVTLVSGCDSVVFVNRSATPVVIEVSAQWGEEGVPPGVTIPGGEISLETNEAITRQFLAPSYGLSEPGNLYSLLRFDAGEGRIEDVFLPRKSTCVVTLNAEDFLEVDVLPELGEADFRNELLARNPDLKRALQFNDKLAAAEVLLHWVANHVDDALVTKDSQATLPIVVKNTVSQSYYEIFKPDKGSVVCGGFAVMLQKLLLFFDIDALIIDFGDPVSKLTHMSVVIPEQHANGMWSFHLYDPKLNFRCVSAVTGQPLGVFEIMNRELSGNFDTVEIVQNSNADRDFVGSAGQLQNPQYQFHRKKGTRYIYRRAEYTLEAHVTDYATQFAGGGFTPGTAGFFELMQVQFYTVRRGNNQASRDAFVQELINRNIPLVYPKYQ